MISGSIENIDIKCAFETGGNSEENNKLLETLDAYTESCILKIETNKNFILILVF